MSGFNIIPPIRLLLVPLVCCQLAHTHYISTFELALMLYNNTLIATTTHYLFAYDLGNMGESLEPAFAARFPLSVAGDDGYRELRMAANSSALLCGTSFCKVCSFEEYGKSSSTWEADASCRRLGQSFVLEEITAHSFFAPIQHAPTTRMSSIISYQRPPVPKTQTRATRLSTVIVESRGSSFTFHQRYFQTTVADDRWCTFLVTEVVGRYDEDGTPRSTAVFVEEWASVNALSYGAEGQPMYYSPLDGSDTSQRVNNLLTFAHDGFVYSLLQVTKLATEADKELATLRLLRYEYDEANRRLERRDVKVECRTRSQECPSLGDCAEASNITLPKDFRWRTATYSDEHIYVVYIRNSLAGAEQVICSFAMSDVGVAFEHQTPECVYGPAQIPRDDAHCVPESVLPLLNATYCTSNEFAARDTVVLGVQIARIHSYETPIRFIAKAHAKERAFFIMSSRSLCRIVRRFPLWWDTTWCEDVSAACYGNCRHDLGNRISPPFTFDRKRNTLFYARDGVLQAVKMTCRNIYPRCDEQAWQTMTADGCAWCAQNDSGYAIPVSDTSLCDGGMVVRDTCPPSITDVQVNGTSYLIRGLYFDNFLKHEFYSAPTKVTIDICDIPCDYGIGDLQSTSITCEVSSEPSCANVTMRGKLIRHSPMTLVYSLEEKRMDASTRISYATAAALVLVTVAMIVSLIYGRFRRLRARQEWEIPYKQLHIEEKIGQGMYGVVFRAYRYGPVAVKQLYMAHPSPSVRRSLENEIRLLKSLRHSNVLNLLGVVTTPQLAIVTDWCHCSLYHKLHVAETNYDEEMQLRVCSQIAEGMNYLHSKAVLHRDLKSGNILLTEANGTSLKICDFGLSTVKSRVDAKPSKDPVGSILWMAPEIINPSVCDGAYPYSILSDVYAFGICLYELLTSTLPYAGRHPDQITYNVGRGAWCPSLPQGRIHSPLLAKLLTSCVSYRPAQRPTFDQICTELRSDSHTSRTSHKPMRRHESGYMSVVQVDDDA